MIWPFAPFNEFLEGLEFYTDVQRAFSEELRVRLLGTPRRAFSHDYRWRANQYERARNLMRGVHPGDFQVPDWADFRATVAAAGAVSLSFDNTSPELTSAMSLIIWQDDETYEELDVASSSAAGLSLTTPLVNDYPRGRVLRLLTCHSPSGLSVDHPAGPELAATVDWVCYDDETMLIEPAVVASGTINMSASADAATTDAGMKAVAAAVLDVASSDTIRFTVTPSGTYNGWSPWGCPNFSDPCPDTGAVYYMMVVLEDSSRYGIIGPTALSDGYAAAKALAQAGEPYTISGHARYYFGVVDNPFNDNTGGASWDYEVLSYFTSSYRGDPLLDDCPVVGADSLPESVAMLFQSVDNGIAPGFRDSIRAQPSEAYGLAWQPRTRAEAWALRQQLLGLRGRQQAFWLPSFNNGLTLAAPISNGASTISIRNVNFATGYPDGGDIYMLLKNGTVITRQVSGATPAGANETLTLTGTMPQAVAVADVKLFCMLTRMRLLQDRVEWLHRPAAGPKVVVAAEEAPLPGA